MNWFKRLFSASPHGRSLPPITPNTHLPMPKVKPCKKEKDVSEPVLAMVKAWEKDKKRFSFDIEEADVQDLEYRVISNYRWYYNKRYKITIKDLRADEFFEVSAYDTSTDNQSVMYIPLRFYRGE